MNKSPSYSLLDDRAILRISGNDAREFLHGIITNNIRNVTDSNSIYAALLSPQGKFLYDFFIGQWQGDLLLDCEAAGKGSLIQRLTMYKLRSKVAIEDLSQGMLVYAAYGEGVAEALGMAGSAVGTTIQHRHGIYYTDPRHTAAGIRFMLESEHAAQSFAEYDLEATPARNYERLRLQLGLPDGSRDFIVDRSLPLELGLDRLGGVDFTKGCYVGQEVTARSKHRATLHKALFRVQAMDKSALPEPGAPVFAGEKEIGILRSSLHDTGLAILRREDVIQAENASIPLTAGDITIIASSPEWFK